MTRSGWCSCCYRVPRCRTVTHPLAVVPTTHVTETRPRAVVPTTPRHYTSSLYGNVVTNSPVDVVMFPIPDRHKPLPQTVTTDRHRKTVTTARDDKTGTTNRHWQTVTTNRYSVSQASRGRRPRDDRAYRSRYSSLSRSAPVCPPTRSRPHNPFDGNTSPRWRPHNASDSRWWH